MSLPNHFEQLNRLSPYFFQSAFYPSSATSLPAHATHTIHENRQVTFSHWVKRSKVPPHQVLSVRIGLAQKNLDRGYEFLMDTYILLSTRKWGSSDVRPSSDSSSSNFGKYWTPIDIAKTFTSSVETVESVIGWLTSSGFNKTRITQSQNKGWLAFGYPGWRSGGPFYIPNITTTSIEALIMLQ